MVYQTLVIKKHDSSRYFKNMYFNNFRFLDLKTEIRIFNFRSYETNSILIFVFFWPGY